MDSQSKRVCVPGWMQALAVHEAERIYEMMPRMIGEKTRVMARLEAGIIELLSRELQQQAA
jgi:hypothetical protein